MSQMIAQDSTPTSREAHPDLRIGLNAQPVFGNRFRMVGMGPRGRLYFDRWHAFDNRPDCYKLVGFGNDVRLTRADAAVAMRSATVRHLGAR